ncbi:unnamed protein product [Dracunculus medinensis]|uniref:Ski_Sno domain-containing protein n=1 Tax=Dracunculus medinensis TaxID=318479 RepID=A0A0N4U2R6_DRAME|nr:unnamed protein product [Dracunculus medinensis]
MKMGRATGDFLLSTQTEGLMEGFIPSEEIGDAQRVVLECNGMVEGISYTAIPVDILAAAGVDVENVSELTENQVNAALALAGSSANTIAIPSVSRQIPTKRVRVPTTQQNPADNLTMFIAEDGSLKLTSSSQQNFYVMFSHDEIFSPEQLAAHNIDVNHLSEETVHRIIQIAMPLIDMYKREYNLLLFHSGFFFRRKANETKRRKLGPNLCSTEQGQSVFNGVASIIPPDRLGLNPHGPSLSPSKVLASMDHGSEHNFSIVGEEVHVKKGNRLVPAIVRYCRTGGEFKVQFADGHFEWIGEDHLQFNGNFFLLIFHLHFHHIFVDYYYYVHLEFFFFEGIKVTSKEPSGEEVEPNFFCLVCDRKVYQKVRLKFSKHFFVLVKSFHYITKIFIQEPQYLVIRVPACDACTKRKILILDTEKADCSVQTSPLIELDSFNVNSNNYLSEQSTNPSPYFDDEAKINDQSNNIKKKMSQISLTVDSSFSASEVEQNVSTSS